MVYENALRGGIPPFVYAPTVSADTTVDPVFRTVDGMVGPELLVYTSLDRLLNLAGPFQPWTLLRASVLPGIVERIGAVRVVFDEEIPQHRRAARRSDVEIELPEVGGRETIVPPVLYVPIESRADDGWELAHLLAAQGDVFLPLYTALDRLIVQWGRGQTWATVHTERIGAIRQRQHYDRLVFDPQITRQD